MRTVLLAAVVVAACAGDNETSNAIELEMTVEIPPGFETEYCRFVAIPDAWVTRDSVEFTAGSHHVLLYQTKYTTIPTQKDDGTPVDTSKPFDCSDGATNGWSIEKLVAGSQNRSGDSLLAFPDGVGIHVGGIGLINAHYINASDAPLASEVKIKLETIDAADVEIEGDILFLYNPLISIPPNRTARAHWRCPVHQDITIANVQSHMHVRGVDFAARVDGNAPFYTNQRWENVPVQSYTDLVVRAGSKLDYYCDYRNTEGRSVYQGPRTTDEMCMLIGSYYPADPRTSNCLDATGNGFGGEWIGQGTATCQATLGCMQAAGNNFTALTDCVLGSAPTVSKEISAVTQCLFNATGDVTAACGAQIQACAAK